MNPAAFRQFLENQRKLAYQTRLLTLQRTHQSRIEAAENHLAALRLRAKVELDALQGKCVQIMSNDERVILEIGLPTGPLVTAAADPDRHQAFLDHLRSVMSEAIRLESPLPNATIDDGSLSPRNIDIDACVDADQPYGPFSRQLCGVCAGGCCPVGANHAFVTADTIVRVQLQGATRTAGELEALYLSYLPGKSQEGGCIYQQAQGCALPRDLRGDTCNTYICESFRAVHEAEQESQIGARHPLQTVIVVQRRQNQWLRDKPALDNAITGLAVVDANRPVLRFEV